MINIDTHVVIIQEKVDKLNSQLKIKKNIKLISGYIISKLNSKDTIIIIYIYNDYYDVARKNGNIKR